MFVPFCGVCVCVCIYFGGFSFCFSGFAHSSSFGAAVAVALTKSALTNSQTRFKLAQQNLAVFIIHDISN